jgi:hypothetical protein
MRWIPMRSRPAPRGGRAGAEKEKKSGWDIAAALGQAIGGSYPWLAWP